MKNIDEWYNLYQLTHQERFTSCIGTSIGIPHVDALSPLIFADYLNEAIKILKRICGDGLKEMAYEEDGIFMAVQNL